MTTLVTGATGFLGRHVTSLLCTRGEPVRVLVQPNEALGPLTVLADRGQIAVYRGDLTDRPSLDAAVQGIDRILHCAAKTGPWGPSRAYWAANVGGLRSLIDAALDARVRRIVHVSSVTVHGNDVGGVADELTPIRIEPNPYSQSKVAGERLLNELVDERNAPVTIVRPGWIYGPGDRASLGRFAAMVEAGKAIVIGSGNNHLPLIHVSDVAHGILLASDADNAVGRSYILVNDESITQNDYWLAMARELEVSAPRRRIPYRLALALGTAAEAVGHLAHSAKPPPLTRYGIQMLGGENRFQIGRARRELGFVPRLDLREGMRDSIAWYRAKDQMSDPYLPKMEMQS
ncbi:MAG TPA: NAD-dependent epimerase/dehydratase family protein [Chloroflexota bacterium]|nr:NAD-dependent epimerase/dehydratase family protein [Chloroflexota bacterium]